MHPHLISMRPHDGLIKLHRQHLQDLERHLADLLPIALIPEPLLAAVVLLVPSPGRRHSHLVHALGGCHDRGDVRPKQRGLTPEDLQGHGARGLDIVAVCGLLHGCEDDADNARRVGPVVLEAEVPDRVEDVDGVDGAAVVVAVSRSRRRRWGRPRGGGGL